MKSVADLIANKNALIKRDKRGKITAASLSAAGVAVLAAAQAEAQGVDGFEDITSSVTSFERIGNGQVEFELENGQRFIANEGQYIIEGNQISVSQELVTIVGGAGINPTVIAVAVAGSALLVGALILLNSDDSTDSTATTTGTTSTTNPGTTTNITSASTGEAVGTTRDDTFKVTDTSALNAITGIDGDNGTDKVTMTEILEPSTSPTLDLGSRGVTLTDVEQFSVTVDAGTTGGTATLNMGGETAAVTVTNTDSSTGTIAIDELGPSASGGTSATLTLVDIEGGQIVDIDTDSGVSKLVANIQNAGDSAADPMELEIDDSGEAITELTIGSDGSSGNFLKIDTSSSTIKLTIDGTENLTLDDTVGAGDMSGIATVDASDASGNIVASVDDTVTALTMGSGNDTITATESPAATAVWNGGSGSDTLDLQGLNTSTATISKFETVIMATGGTANFTNITDIDDLQVSGSVTLNNLGDGAVDEQITFTNDANISIASATETSLKFEGAAGTVGNLTIANSATALTEIIFEQVASGELTLTGTNTDVLDLRGNEDVTLAGTGIAALTTVDASSANDVTVSAAAAAFDAIYTYTGSSGMDDIDIDGVAANAVILTAGDDDVIVFTSAATNGNSATVSLGSGDDSVTLDDAMDTGSITLDGGAGVDTFDLGTTATVDVIIKIDVGDNAVELAGGVVDTSDFETLTGFQQGASGDIIDLGSLNLTGPIVYETSGVDDADGFNNAYNDIMNDIADVIFIDADTNGNVQYIFYDNGDSGVGVIDFGGDIISLSQVDGDDLLI